jgi:hypothetical protein
MHHPIRENIIAASDVLAEFGVKLPDKIVSVEKYAEPDRSALRGATTKPTVVPKCFST